MVENQGRKTEDLAVSTNGEEEEEAGELSSQSSSIGAFSSSSTDDEENGEEIQSNFKDAGSLNTLISLEESLPIKNGLSNFFVGKSRSFACLADALSGNARDLGKPENAFNKRRRIMAKCKDSWKRSASCTLLEYSFSPLLFTDLVKEEGEEYEDDDDEEVEQRRKGFLLADLSNIGKNFKKSRSHSLSDFS